MFEVVNQTPFAADSFHGWSLMREPSAVVVVKAAFRFDLRGHLSVLPKAAPIELTDRFCEDPYTTSLLACDESVIQKNGAEILLLGAIARAIDPMLHVMEVAAGLRFGDGSQWTKTLRVLGKRHYEKSVVGPRISEPEWLQPTPIIYENAYGGASAEDPDDFYEPNPVGKGYCRSWLKATGVELPLIEQGPDWITSVSHRPAAAGFGPLAAHWAPRVSERGTPDGSAADTGACPMGADVTPSFYNCAPLDQRFSQPFSGGELLSLTNLVPGAEWDQPVSITLPKLAPKAILIIGARRTPLHLRCDTVSVHTETRELHLIYRAALPWSLTDRRTAYVVVQDDSLALRATETQRQAIV